MPQCSASVNKRDHNRLILSFILGFSLVLAFNPTSPVQAASPITSSGLNTQVTLSATPPAGKTQFDITGGTRPGGGSNLFHSFGQFNVPNNNIANFLNDSGLATSNILGRVTGGNISNIFGTIQTTGFGNANLFMMNPAGFLFGPNATINVGGMVSFTSADYLRLADGVRFNAVPDAAADALLSTAPVAAFGFLGSNPGAITVQGSQLSVTPGQSISLVGGNIAGQSGMLDNETVQAAKLSAPGGQINLASVASPGEILTGTMAQAPNINGQSFTAMGNISLSQGTSLDTSADTAGRIVIRGGQLMMDDASIMAISMNGTGGAIDTTNTSPTISITAETVALANGTYITADSHGSAPAGNITFQVGTLTTQAGTNRVLLEPIFPDLVVGNLIASDSRSVNPDGGAAGNITIEGLGGHGTGAHSVLLKDAAISSRIFGGTLQTAPSSITITADSVVLTNAGLPGGGTEAATLVANTIGPAPAGDIVFHVNTLRINFNPDETPIAGSHKVFIVTSNNPGDTAGPTGSIKISGIRPNDAARLVALNNTFLSTGSDGGTPKTPAGNITITTDTLSVSNDTGIFTTAFNDLGAPAGNISLNVNTLRANIMPDGTLITGVPQVFIDSVSLSGQAGNITISGVKPETSGAAKQLALNNIEMNTVLFGGPGQTAQTAPATLTVTADNIHLTHSPSIKTNTQGAAPAGNIVFTANTLLADQGSKISSTSSGSGPGGTIFINGQSVALNSGSSVTASSTGAGNAGNILVKTDTFSVTGGASITASSTGAGKAGTVTIKGTASPAQSVLIDGAGSGLFTTTSGTGTGGDISINANAVTLQNNAHVSSSSTGTGSAGNITINAGTQFTMTNSTVTTEADQSSGGAITITTNPSGTVQLTDSKISASVLNGTGGGGSVTIDPQFVLLQNSQILANAVFGPGGNIFITTNLLQPDATSVISASSQFGQNGTITVQSPIAPASRIILLSQKPLVATSLLNLHCAKLAQGIFSSFAVAGRDSLPAEPSSWLNSPLAVVIPELVGRTATEPDTRTSLSESTEEMPVLSLRLIAPPGFLT